MLKNKTVQLGILWLFIVPPIFIYLILNHMPQELNWLYIGTIVVIAFLTILFPIRRNGDAYMFVVWITVLAFLLYGLLVEIIVTQIALLAKVFYNRKEERKVQQLIFNSLLFFLLSCIAAAGFHLAGGRVGSMAFGQLVFAIAVYQVIHRFLNDSAKRLYASRMQVSGVYFTKRPLLESLYVLVILPFTLTLYYLVQYIGFGAFLLLGIPYFFIVIVSRLHNQTEKINRDLQRVAAMGYRLSYNLTEEEVIDQFAENISGIIEADYTYVFDHRDGWLELIRAWEYGELVSPEMSHSYLKNTLAYHILKQKEALIYHSKKEWSSLTNGQEFTDMQSVLAIPIARNQKIEGILLAFSTRKNAFQDFQLKIADILSSYFTVSVEKARNMAETVEKSERCGLTKLYNYHFLEERLTYEQQRLERSDITSLSVIMLDIDHFKQVNDTYGHASGNDVLVELAAILNEATPEGGIVGRYGGEEFIFILPGVEKKQAYHIAEYLRLKIEAHRFHIKPDLEDDKKEVTIAITASIGVSANPEDADEAKNLISNADRALYLGAKRSGRNRVASYVK